MSGEHSKKSAAGRKNHSEQDCTSSLSSYLNSVGRISQADPVMLQTLAESVDELQLEIGKRLARFGFTALEYCRILEECSNSGSSPEDFFLSSSLRQGGTALPLNLLEQLNDWKEEIRNAHALLEETFEKGLPCHEKRDDLLRIMEKFRINGVMARELYQTAAGYTELNPEHYSQAEKRFLMNADEIKEALRELDGMYAELEKRHTRMAECNLRLVVSIAGKYRECNVPLNDIIQEGNLGLMVAVQRFDKEGEPFEFFVNPEIVELGDDAELGGEGCLSVPEIRGEVRRAQSLVLRYRDATFEERTERVEGFTAVIFQHEIDHLDGVLFVDKMEAEIEAEEDDEIDAEE